MAHILPPHTTTVAVEANASKTWPSKRRSVPRRKFAMLSFNCLFLASFFSVGFGIMYVSLMALSTLNVHDNAIDANLRHGARDDDDYDASFLDKYWADFPPKARAEAKVLGFTEDLWDSNHAEMDSHLFPLYETPLRNFTARERKAMNYLRLGALYKLNSYRPEHLRNRPRYIDRADLTEEQIEKLSKMKILLFITTHLSEEHERALRKIWPGLVSSSPLLSNADVLLHHSNMLPDLKDLLRSIFPTSNVTIVPTENEGYQEGAIKALSDAIEHRWFENYEWVVRVNPDVIIRNDTWIVSQMLDPDVRGVLVDCYDGLLNKSGEGRAKAHTDFYAIRPRYLANQTEALELELDDIENAEDHFTAAAEDVWSTGHAAILPDNDLNRDWCRVRGDSSSVVHNHEYLDRYLDCLDKSDGSHDNCKALTAVEFLEWQYLSPKARNAARSLGFSGDSWSEWVDSNDDDDAWKDNAKLTVFHTPWDKLGENERRAVSYIGLERQFERSVGR